MSKSTTSNKLDSVLGLAFISCMLYIVYLLFNYDKKIVQQYELESISSSIKIMENKLSPDVFMTRYVVKEKDLLSLLNRQETNKDDLEGYLKHLKKEYADTRYCLSSNASKATCLNLKEGIYESDILGAAAWANLYGNLDRKLSKEALMELVKPSIQKANIPPVLSLKAGFDPSFHSIEEKIELERQIRKLERQIRKLERQIEVLNNKHKEEVSNDSKTLENHRKSNKNQAEKWRSFRAFVYYSIFMLIVTIITVRVHASVSKL